MNIVTLESCHSTWIFDAKRMRFCRILKYIEIAQRHVSTEWRPYAHLEICPDTETFCVYLTEDRSRAIRSWLHIGNCAECGDHQTAEPSIDNVHMNLLVGASGR